MCVIFVRYVGDPTIVDIEWIKVVQEREGEGAKRDRDQRWERLHWGGTATRILDGNLEMSKILSLSQPKRFVCHK